MNKVFTYIKNHGILTCYFKFKAKQILDNRKSPNLFDKLLMKTFHYTKSNKRKVAIIGTGYFAFSVIGNFLVRYSGASIKYVYDIDKRKQNRFEKFFAIKHSCNDLDDIKNDREVELVYIATNHSLHCQYAIEFLRCGKSVHIEKPHVTNNKQLKMLSQIIRTSNCGNIFLGFNRSKSPLFQKIKRADYYDQSLFSLNMNIIGHKLPNAHWYNKRSEGGRVLGNLTHWIELIFHFTSTESWPCIITPIRHDNCNKIIVINFRLQNGSQITLTFSALGETVSGVKEYITYQKGDYNFHCIDFQKCTVEINGNVVNKNTLRKNLGHQSNIINSYENRIANKEEAMAHVINSAKLSLLTFYSVVLGRPLNFTPTQLNKTSLPIT